MHQYHVKVSCYSDKLISVSKENNNTQVTDYYSEALKMSFLTLVFVCGLCKCASTNCDLK